MNIGPMKRTIYYLLFLCLLTGCYPDMKPQLEEAEALLTENPDSAYRLLQSIERPERRQEAEYATWCLLMTQATDKSFREHTSDSLIRVAVRYFSKQHDPERLATALYTQGRVEKELGKNEEAAQLFVKALDVAKGGEDYELQFLASSHLGTLYAYFHLDSLAFSAYEQALHFAELSGDSVNLAYAYAYLGRVYGLREEWDKAIVCYQKTIAVSQQIHYIPTLRLGLNEQASIYTAASDFAQARLCLQELRKLIQKYTPSDFANEALTIGDLYRLMQQPDSARFYLEKALQTDNMYTRKGAYRCFYLLYKAERNYPRALHYNDLYITCSDSLQKEENRKAVIAVETRYNNEKLRMEKAMLHGEYRENKIVFALVTITLLCILFGIYSFFQHRLSNTRKQILENRKQLDDLLDEQKKYKTVMLQKQQEIETLALRANEKLEIQEQLAQKQEQLGTLQKAYEEIHIRIIQVEQQLSQQGVELATYKKLTKSQDNVLTVLARIRKKGYIQTLEEWKQLVAVVDALYDLFTQRLKSVCPDLTRGDICLCCLIKLNYKTQQIAELLGIQEDALFKRKQRIREKIAPQKKWKKGELDNFIKNFPDGMSE